MMRIFFFFITFVVVYPEISKEIGYFLPSLVKKKNEPLTASEILSIQLENKMRFYTR